MTPLVLAARVSTDGACWRALGGEVSEVTGVGEEEKLMLTWVASDVVPAHALDGLFAAYSKPVV